MKSKKIVCVEWDDAGFNSGYYDEDNKDIHTPIIVKTVGHLIKRTKAVVIVATDTYQYAKSDGDSRYISTIPRKMVKKISYLEVRSARSV